MLTNAPPLNFHVKRFYLHLKNASSQKEDIVLGRAYRSPEGLIHFKPKWFTLPYHWLVFKGADRRVCLRLRRKVIKANPEMNRRTKCWHVQVWVIHESALTPENLDLKV